jgi:hypothetical protein
MSITTKDNAQKKSTWKGWIFPAIAAGVLVASLGGLAATNAEVSNERAAQEATILELKERVTELSLAEVTAAEQAAALSAGAPSGELASAMERIDADGETIKKLAETVFTWDSTDSYEQAREALMIKFGVAENDRFMTTFLPPAPVSVDANGKEYRYSEAARLNSALGALTVKPTLVHGTKYEYLVNASVQSSSNDGTATASRGVVLKVSTEADGSVVSVEGWASPTPLRSSGAM